MVIRRRAAVMTAQISLATALLTAPAAGRTEGPLTAQIIDAETGKPVVGVIVVALYQKKTPGTVHPNTDFYDLDETVTDADGRFSFPARELPTSTPLVHVIGPEMIIFKAGYAGWRFQGVDSRQHVDPGVRDAAVAEGWRKFKTTGVVIEITPVKTRDERSLARSYARRFPPIPEDRAPRLHQALEDEALAIQKLR
jgi:hypothetical protein